MDLTNKKFLVCDDSILARKQIKDTINNMGEGATFIEAKNGQEAVDLYKSEKPDMAFLDIVMPIKEGTVAVKEICEFDPDAFVVMVSSVGTQALLKTAIENGASDFVQKPLDMNQLTAIIKRKLGGE